MPQDPRPRISAAYLRFAEREARGRSPLYETLAREVAGDGSVLDFLASLPREKRQPNLLLAAARHVFGTAGGWLEFRRKLLERAEEVCAVMRERSTQTNEPGRCAALLPILAALPQPLALLEVGASAGLCLLPDRYGYDYGRRRLRPANSQPAEPIFSCTADDRTPLPPALPQIVWRAGLDLNPIDLTDRAQTAWLKTLVWPDQTGRLQRLEAAIRVAVADPPRLVRGDLRHDLAALATEAPAGATRVIFHTAVLAYLADPADRAEFARSVAALRDFWIANEAPHVFPEIAARAGASPSKGIEAAGGGPVGDARFLISLNGKPRAWTDPHGTSLVWIGDPVAGEGDNR